jgi:hypothetical protein
MMMEAGMTRATRRPGIPKKKDPPLFYVRASNKKTKVFFVKN